MVAKIKFDLTDDMKARLKLNNEQLKMEKKLEKMKPFDMSRIKTKKESINDNIPLEVRQEKNKYFELLKLKTALAMNQAEANKNRDQPLNIVERDLMDVMANSIEFSQLVFEKSLILLNNNYPAATLLREELHNNSMEEFFLTNFKRIKRIVDTDLFNPTFQSVNKVVIRLHQEDKDNIGIYGVNITSSSIKKLAETLINEINTKTSNNPVVNNYNYNMSNSRHNDDIVNKLKALVYVFHTAALNGLTDDENNAQIVADFDGQNYETADDVKDRLINILQEYRNTGKIDETFLDKLTPKTVQSTVVALNSQQGIPLQQPQPQAQPLQQPQGNLKNDLLEYETKLNKSLEDYTDDDFILMAEFYNHSADDFFNFYKQLSQNESEFNKLKNSGTFKIGLRINALKEDQIKIKEKGASEVKGSLEEYLQRETFMKETIPQMQAAYEKFKNDLLKYNQNIIKKKVLKKDIQNYYKDARDEMNRQQQQNIAAESNALTVIEKAVKNKKNKKNKKNNNKNDKGETYDDFTKLDPIRQVRTIKILNDESLNRLAAEAGMNDPGNQPRDKKYIFILEQYCSLYNYPLFSVDAPLDVVEKHVIDEIKKKEGNEIIPSLSPSKNNHVVSQNQISYDEFMNNLGPAKKVSNLNNLSDHDLVRYIHSVIQEPVPNSRDESERLVIRMFNEYNKFPHDESLSTDELKQQFIDDYIAMRKATTPTKMVQD